MVRLRNMTAQPVYIDALPLMPGQSRLYPATIINHSLIQRMISNGQLREESEG